jgi:hypothetical protein
LCVFGAAEGVDCVDAVDGAADENN